MFDCFKVITWNIEGIFRNAHSLKHVANVHDVDFIFISEPMCFQNDIGNVMQYLRGEFHYSLNSSDKYDPELPLIKAKSNGGSMVLWRNRLDPYVIIHPVSSPAILPIIFNPPGNPTSIHICVYLPTHGQDDKFIEELSNLEVCLDELLDLYPEAFVFLRGDFNVSYKNEKRAALLHHFCSEFGLLEVVINHKTYHHFTGNGESDSDLDKLFGSNILEYPEIIMKIHCKKDDPTIDSHHDLIVSQFNLPKSEITLPDSQNITAPKVINDRTKVFWTSEGVEHYQHIVAPELHRINQLWLQKTCESISSVSLLFESTNKILTKSANIANKTVKLDSKVQLRSKKTPPAIRKSARQLLSKHRELSLHPHQSML